MDSDPQTPAADRHHEHGWRTVPLTLRRVDWLAVAPWTLLLRTPALALRSLPVLAGLWIITTCGGSGSVVVSPTPELITESALRATKLAWFRWPDLGVGFHSVIELQIAIVAGLYASCAAMRWASPRFTHGLSLPTAPAAVAFSLRRTHRALLAALLAVIPGLMLIGLGRLLGGAIDDSSPFYLGVVVRSIVQLSALLGFVCCLIAAAASPFIVAAVAIDDADSFDAASRAVAYVTQRPLLMLWCVAVTGLVILASGLVVETMIEGSRQMSDWMLHPDNVEQVVNEEAHMQGGPLAAFLRMLLRSFYPACWIVGIAGAYLVLRHSVDGQPIDEIAPWRGEETQLRGDQTR